MPAPSLLSHGLVRAALLVSLWSAACGVAGATEHPPSAMSASVSAAESAPASTASPPARAPASADAARVAQPHATPASAVAARGPQDPMEMLRARLAQKLGATTASGSASPNELRIVSKAKAPVAAEPAAALAGAARGAPRKLASAAASRVAHAAARAVPWDYSGRGGPDSWGRIKPEYAKCASGTRQSPIDIRDGIKVELDPIRFDYQPSAFRVIDTGHTVQVDVDPGSSIEVLGRRYALVRFDFHRPSEERIDGKPFEMVVHLVHEAADGRLAVVAVLLERGSAQAVVQRIWNNLPLEQGEPVAARTTLNPADLLPADRSYYTYMGSLTAPPCSEGVLWMVMKHPVPVSAEQIAIFARLYPMNARPIQAAGGRLIKESD